MSPLMHDRGRGPELIGTRITVYNLLPYFLDPTATEEYVCDIYELTPEQVAAARAYVLLNFEEVMRVHRQIVERLNQPNPPHVLEQLERNRAALDKYREWFALRSKADTPTLPSFREWMAARKQESQPTSGGVS